MQSAALQRAIDLMEIPPDAAASDRGYLDLLGPETSGRRGLATLLMNSPVLPTIYEKYWRPTLTRIAKGPGGPTMSGEYDLMRAMLAVEAGDTVLDVACGPGNFCRTIAADAGPDGLVVGLDGSRTMLDRAVRDTRFSNIAYLRADAGTLPLRSASVDAVCCYAALYLFDEPWAAVDEMTRVLRPGGRITLMTSAAPSWAPVAAAARVGSAIIGIRLFGRDELVDALQERGYRRIVQEIAGTVQFVSAVHA